ncbi:MAG: tetratricopeptide repeat protein [Erythrobacter sp.]
MARSPTDLSKTDDGKPSDEQKPEDKDPAAPSAEDEILMREIDEAVRKDDAGEFLSKYGVPLGSLLAVLLIGFAGYLFWDSQNEGDLEEQSETLVQALDASEQEEYASAATTAADLNNADTPGARTSARFIQANAALEEGKTDEAVALFKQIADDADAPQPLRDLARVREVATNFDQRKPADIIAVLKDLAEPGNPFFGSAGEMTAIAHMNAGDRDKAGTMFAAIAKDEDAPETLRNRARQMAGLLGVDAIEDVEEFLEDEGVVPADEAGEGASE